MLPNPLTLKQGKLYFNQRKAWQPMKRKPHIPQSNQQGPGGRYWPGNASSLSDPDSFCSDPYDTDMDAKSLSLMMWCLARAASKLYSVNWGETPWKGTSAKSSSSFSYFGAYTYSCCFSLLLCSSGSELMETILIFLLIPILLLMIVGMIFAIIGLGVVVVRSLMDWELWAGTGGSPS